MREKEINSIEVVSKRPLLENLSWIAGVAGFVVSILSLLISSYFAYKTYYNTEQISKLDTLIHAGQKNTQNLQRNTDTLISVVNALREQNQLILDENKTIVHQSKAIDRQLIISQQEQKISNEFYKFSKNRDRNNFRVAFQTIRNKWLEFSQLERLHRNESIDQRKYIQYFLNDLQTTVQSQLTNAYLITDDSLSNHWIRFDQHLSYTIRILKEDRIAPDLNLPPEIEEANKDGQLELFKIIFARFYTLTANKLY
ncbi:MAG TPA: hypothetical protein VF622_08745 [Segetibacter sp.]